MSSIPVLEDKVFSNYSNNLVLSLLMEGGHLLVKKRKLVDGEQREEERSGDNCCPSSIQSRNEFG